MGGTVHPLVSGAVLVRRRRPRQGVRRGNGGADRHPFGACRAFSSLLYSQAGYWRGRLRVEAGFDLDEEDDTAAIFSAVYYLLTRGLVGEPDEQKIRAEWLANITKIGLDSWVPVRAEPGRTVVEVRAHRGAGQAEAGTLGVSLGAAGDFVRRQQALAAERKAARAAEAEKQTPELAGSGVVIRRG